MESASLISVWIRSVARGQECSQGWHQGFQPEPPGCSCVIGGSSSGVCGGLYKVRPQLGLDLS